MCPSTFGVGTSKRGNLTWKPPIATGPWRSVYRSTAASAGAAATAAVIVAAASASPARRSTRPTQSDLAHRQRSVELRAARFARRYPRLYALRHVAKAAAALIGIALLVNLLPAIPWPDIPLPSIDLPEIPWPDIPWPQFDLPAAPEWLAAILEAKKYWLPILIGIVLAVRELRKRKRGDRGDDKLPPGASRPVELS
jgi:hypothetical protein